MPKTFTGKKYFSRDVKKKIVSFTTQLQVDTAIVETELSNICLRGYIPVSSGLCLLGRQIFLLLFWFLSVQKGVDHNE
jgi:hypothetical protein